MGSNMKAIELSDEQLAFVTGGGSQSNSASVSQTASTESEAYVLVASGGNTNNNNIGNNTAKNFSYIWQENEKKFW